MQSCDPPRERWWCSPERQSDALVQLQRSFPQVDAFGAWIKVFVEGASDPAGARRKWNWLLPAAIAMAGRQVEPELEDVVHCPAAPAGLAVGADSPTPVALRLRDGGAAGTDPGALGPPAVGPIAIEARRLDAGVR